MNTEFIKGVVVPIITVIDEDERIDEQGMRDQVEYVIRGGMQGILVLAPTASSIRSRRTRWSAA